MTLRGKVMALVELVLRVPPLIVIDEILKLGIGLSELPERDLSSGDDFFKAGRIKTSDFDFSRAVEPDPTFYRIVLVSLARLLLSSIGVLFALCMFVLSSKYLMILYMYLASIGVVFISYWSNQNMVKTMLPMIMQEDLQTSILEQILSLKFEWLTNPDNNIMIVLSNYLVQCVLALIFNNIHLGPRYSWLTKLLPLSFMAPTILALLPLPVIILNHSPVFSALLPLALVKFVLWSSFTSIVPPLWDGYLYARNLVQNFGLSVLIESEWIRLKVANVLRTFWLLRVLEHSAAFFIANSWADGDINGQSYMYLLVKNIMVTGSDTLTAVLGITSIVSYICHHIGLLFQWILLTEDENDKSIGTVSAMLFYILALQTGLTSLEPDKRFVRLCRNFCLLFTALLHFIHNIVNPLLMSLSASHIPSLKRHIRALMVCLFLVVIPIVLLYYLWFYNSVSTWLLAVSAFSIEVVVKVAVSLCIYSLFLWDARRETFWEKLDDYVYYIRAFGNTVEFCFGIFLFFNGAWILVFESGGAIRAVMMCIHAYFNIWCDARSGWSVFIKRRTAVNKIESLPEANEKQLQELRDVCAICYQDMRTAKMTRCGHFFHGVCLRKWLYVQDRCPLCHKILHGVEYDEPKEQNGHAGVYVERDNYNR